MSLHICHVNMYEAVQAYTHNNSSMQLQKGQTKASIIVSFRCIHLCIQFVWVHACYEYFGCIHMCVHVGSWHCVLVCMCVCVHYNMLKFIYNTGRIELNSAYFG